ncbi:hypothetical protein ACO2Q1_08870 [Brevundimonas sp. VNH65]|uniref:hypothetical protein n=1 Tax=Brevundimonas sp. VNH65 TaxID=3400917 RepID=UPI003C047859
MNVLILAAGDRGPGAETYPIWLSEVDGQLVLERQVAALDLGKETRFVFAFGQSDIEEHHVDDIARQIAPDAAVLSIRRRTAGAACTALLSVGHLDLEAELIVASATDHVEANYATIISGFRSKGADAGVLTFESLHPRYSYVRLDAEGWVIEAAEKRPISRRANSGFYWYRRAGDFVASLQEMILKGASVNDVFYIAPSLNELVLQGKRIAAHALAPDQYHPMKDQRMVDQLGHTFEERIRHAS